VFPPASGDDPASPTHRLGPDDAPVAGAPWRLIILREGEVSQHELPMQGGVSLGRAEQAVIQVPHRSVSRLHAMLHVLGDKILLEDLGSANGTRVRGQAIAQGETVPVGRGDAFEIGSVTILIERVGARGTPVVATGESSAERQEELERLVERVAQGTISVLLLGETGVGKEVLAERIHQRSKRADKPMLKLNCAALAESLLESELFGYEKGAFTGAVAQKRGLLETADGGTVFLDEIGELPAPTQAKLLRVLEERKVTRVGGLKPIDIDMRFISATNRDLEAESAAGRFRQDLYFRLAAITLVIPPLRRRIGEIAGLAQRFIADCCAREERTDVPALSRAALVLLEGHAWPGNVRELRNAIERAVVLCEGPTILPEHLPLDRGRVTVQPEDPASALRDEVGTFELQRILDAIERCGGNQVKAAKLLGISRRTLVSRLSKAGLTKKRTR
jgi:DNA-binding NtrC family response regulator